jgi:hypothetical protein
MQGRQPTVDGDPAALADAMDRHGARHLVLFRDALDPTLWGDAIAALSRGEAQPGFRQGVPRDDAVVWIREP